MKRSPANSRLKIDLWLYKDGAVVLRTSKRIKTRIRAIVQERSNSEWNSGRLRVWYSKSNDYWNEGRFADIETFEELLITFTELNLVRDFV